MLILISLLLIFIENNLFSGGLLAFISLTFLTYIINRQKTFLFILIVYFLIASQTDRYFIIFIIMSVYVGLNYFMVSHIEYNMKSLFYYLLLQLLTYAALSYKFLDLQYFIINIIGLIIFDYIYYKCSYIKDNI